MNVAYESGITDYRNKDVLQIGFAKYKQMGSQFAEFEKELQNGWFLLPVGDETKKEEENLETARLLKELLLTLHVKHVTLLAAYENDILQEGPNQNNDISTLKRIFVMVPHENGFTEKFLLETVKLLAEQFKQQRFFVKFCSANKIKKYCKGTDYKSDFTESEDDFFSLTDVLENGITNKNYKCIFKGFRTPSSWIDAVVMERSGMLWY